MIQVFRWLAVVAMLIVVGTPARSASAQTPNAPPGEAIEAARELLALMSKDMIADLVGQVTTQMWPAIEARLRSYNANIDDAALADLRNELERIQIDYMMNIVKDGPEIYARHFTVQELREVIAFYRTPTGGKLLKVTPKLTAEIMAMITPHMPDFYGRTIEAFAKVLRSRGYHL
jgi:uncharacterized protein